MDLRKLIRDVPDFPKVGIVFKDITTLTKNPAGFRQTIDEITDRYRDRRLTPDTSPDLDLGIDSMEWLNLTLEIRRDAGVELEEEEIAEVATVRDLLEAVSEKAVSGGRAPTASPLEEPERMLSRAQMRWLEPTGPVEHGLARGLFAVDRWIVRRVFGLRTLGLENVPAEGAFLITPNHVSYLDPFAVAAALVSLVHPASRRVSRRRCAAA